MILENKKGSMAFVFIYGLGFIIGLGIIYIVFNQIAQNDIRPVIQDTIPDDSIHKQHIVDLNDTWMSYWEAVPFLLLLTVVLYWFVGGVAQGNIKQ